MDSRDKDFTPQSKQSIAAQTIKVQQLSKLSTLTDRFGNSFYFGNAGDYWHTPFDLGPNTDYRTHVRNIRDMAIREDDILICSFPKTGFHWHQEIIHMLRNQNTEMIDDSLDSQLFLDARPVSYVDTASSPRVLFTHVPFRYVPRQAFEKQIKVVYLDRNPKDVLVSYYKDSHGMKEPFHYPGTFEHFFYLNFECGYMYGDIFDYLMEWQRGIEDNRNAQIYTSVYEDMKSDPVEGVVGLNEFLGTGCSKELCQAIAEACSFKNMKVTKEANMPQQLKDLFKENAPGFYRKGEVGDWKNWFTVAMNERFEDEFARRMSGYKTVYKFTL